MGGDYRFSLNGVEMLAHVTIAKVLMEGSGVMATQNVNKHSLNAVIDLGGRTINLYVTRGQQPDEELCTHVAIGVEQCADAISRSFESLHGRPLGRDELDRVIREYAKYGKVKYEPPVDGGPVNVNAIAKATILEYQEQVVSFIRARWNSSESGKVASRYDSIVIVGGGAYLFDEAIHKHIPHAKILPNAEFGNSIGYAKVAERLLEVRHG